MTIFRKNTTDRTAIYAQLKAASGLPDRRIPHGFSAAAGVDFGDIYTDDNIAKLRSAETYSEIESCLSRLNRSDYGDITDDEREENEDNILFANGKRLIARYKISVGCITVFVDNDYTLVSLS